MKPTIYIHHDAYYMGGPHLGTVNLQHKREGYPESKLGYHTFYQFFIERDGEWKQTRPAMDPDVVYKPEHKNSISVCLAGNFDREYPTREQYHTLYEILDVFRRKYDVNPLHIKEHRDYQKTSCPGSNIKPGTFARFFAYRGYGLIHRTLYLSLLKIQAMLQ